MHLFFSLQSTLPVFGGLLLIAAIVLLLLRRRKRRSLFNTSASSAVVLTNFPTAAQPAENTPATDQLFDVLPGMCFLRTMHVCVRLRSKACLAAPLSLGRGARTANLHGCGCAAPFYMHAIA